VDRVKALRLVSERHIFTLKTLEKIAEATGTRVEIEFVAA
jgi:hypothetical protein